METGLEMVRSTSDSSTKKVTFGVITPFN